MNRKKEVAVDLASFSLDVGVSFLAQGIPLPASMFLKYLYGLIQKPSSRPRNLNITNPNLDKYLSNGNSELVAILGQKLVHDFFNSCIGDREEIYRARQSSLERFEFISENKTSKIHLPITQKVYLQDAKLKESLRNPSISLGNLDFLKENEFLAKEISKRKDKLKVNLTSVCASSVAVLLSLKERYDMNIEVSYHYVNARSQMQVIIFEGKKNIDFILTANPTFSFHSDDLLSIQKWALLREIHYENQFLMENPRKGMFSRSKDYVSVYSKSTAEEQFYLIQKQIQSKRNKIDDFQNYPDLDDNYAFAWEPLAFHLENLGWKKVPEVQHEIIFSIFGKDSNNKSLLNKYFIELFCREWLICRRDLERCLELLLERNDFAQKFKVGSGLRN